MSSENARVVRELFDATNRRDFGRALSLLAEDVELVFAATHTTPGTYRGRTAVGRFYGDWLRSFEGGYSFDIVELAEGDDSVAVVARHRATGARSGITLEDDRYYAYRLREGLIVHIEMHDTREATFRSVGIAREHHP